MTAALPRLLQSRDDGGQCPLFCPAALTEAWPENGHRYQGGQFETAPASLTGEEALPSYGREVSVGGDALPTAKGNRPGRWRAPEKQPGSRWDRGKVLGRSGISVRGPGRKHPAHSWAVEGGSFGSFPMSLNSSGFLRCGKKNRDLASKDPPQGFRASRQAQLTLSDLPTTGRGESAVVPAPSKMNGVALGHCFSGLDFHMVHWAREPGNGRKPAFGKHLTYIYR